MTARIIASLDVMGGDKGPEIVLPGAELALSRFPDIGYRLFGDEALVRPLLARFPKVADVSTFEHCEVSVKMDDKPSQALRRGRGKSSMWRAIEATKEGADYAVSAGNTGALMAMANFCLRGSGEVHRPAIAGVWPTLKGESVVLDCGSSIGADADTLFAYAIMGSAMARALLGKQRPTVGLLNVGVEEVKGLEEIRTASQMLRDADLHDLQYIGFVEGSDIGKGTADVVVTEGFAGNIALKVAEGTARQVAGYMREAIAETFLSRLGYFIARGAFRKLRTKLNPSRSNGGVFLGLNGIVIKSHGGTDVEGFATAIEVGRSVARGKIVDRINNDLAASRARLAAAGALAETAAK